MDLGSVKWTLLAIYRDINITPDHLTIRNPFFAITFIQLTYHCSYSMPKIGRGPIFGHTTVFSDNILSKVDLGTLKFMLALYAFILFVFTDSTASNIFQYN